MLRRQSSVNFLLLKYPLQKVWNIWRVKFKLKMEVQTRVPAINMESAQKVIQQQLVLILHAHSCLQKEEREDAASECTLPYCKSTKEVINHIRNCFDGSNCTFEHCAASQQIISHWKHCSQKKRCKICGPVFVSQINNAMNAMPH